MTCRRRWRSSMCCGGRFRVACLAHDHAVTVVDNEVGALGGNGVDAASSMDAADKSLPSSSSQNCHNLYSALPVALHTARSITCLVDLPAQGLIAATISDRATEHHPAASIAAAARSKCDASSR